MTITTWPIDATPAVPGRQLREAHSVYMAGASATDPFGVRSGVRPGTSPTTVTATSTTWTVGAHAGVVDLQPAVEASGYEYAVNATGGLPSGPVTAADATRPRVDIVWVRNDDPSEGDASPKPTVVFGYTAGAPLAIPVAPATPARCMVLATIQVPMSGGGSPTVIWVAPYTVAAGAPTPVYSAADRAAKFPVPYDGLTVYRLDLHCTERYDGTIWHSGAAPIVYTDGGLTTSGTINVYTTALRTVTDPFGAGVPYRCEVIYSCGIVTAAAGVTGQAGISTGSGEVSKAIISSLCSATVNYTIDMPSGGTKTFQGDLTSLSGSMATTNDSVFHRMVTKVTPL